MSLVCLNQNAERRVSTSPLWGMPSRITTSKADMRSVVTINNRSPRSKVSRTLPLPKRGKGRSTVSTTSGITGTSYKNMGRDEYSLPIHCRTSEGARASFPCGEGVRGWRHQCLAIFQPDVFVRRQHDLVRITCPDLAIDIDRQRVVFINGMAKETGSRQLWRTKSDGVAGILPPDGEEIAQQELARRRILRCLNVDDTAGVVRVQPIETG